MFFCCLAVLLLLAPLYKAGNRPIPLLLFELVAIGLLLVIIAWDRAPMALPRTLMAAMALLLIYPLVQLVPLPESVWRALPGHGEYATVLDQFAARDADGAWRSISVIPAATEYGWLALLPPLACLLGAMRLSMAHAARLLLLLAMLAGAEGVLGLLQVGPSGGGVLYFGNEEPGQYVAIGTYVNRNHLAALLAMALPVIVGLLVYSVRPGRHTHRQRQPPPSEVVAKRALLFAAAVIAMVCLIFTRSRAGIATGAVGLACAAFVLVRARAARGPVARSRTAIYVVIGLVVIAMGLALAIGVRPLLRGLEHQQLQTSVDFRWTIYAATLHAAAEFFPFGSGLSTFAGVFPQFQLADAGGFIDYAHNDYLQALLELGLAAPVIIALLFAAFAARFLDLMRLNPSRSFRLLQLAAGLGMVPMMLHSLFDFGLHMPANAMWFAALAGVMFHEGIRSDAEAEGATRAARPPDPTPRAFPVPDFPTSPATSTNAQVPR